MSPFDRMLAFNEMPRRPHPVVEVDILTLVVWHVTDFRGVSIQVVSEPETIEVEMKTDDPVDQT